TTAGTSAPRSLRRPMRSLCPYGRAFRHIGKGKPIGVPDDGSRLPELVEEAIGDLLGFIEGDRLPRLLATTFFRLGWILGGIEEKEEAARLEGKRLADLTGGERLDRHGDVLREAPQIDGAVDIRERVGAVGLLGLLERELLADDLRAHPHRLG